MVALPHPAVTAVRVVSVCVFVALLAGCAGSGGRQDMEPPEDYFSMVLPGMNGFQATRAITRDDTTRDIPVLIVSTKGMETDKAWGMRQGARDYVVKPPREADLIARINAALGA